MKLKYDFKVNTKHIIQIIYLTQSLLQHSLLQFSNSTMVVTTCLVKSVFINISIYMYSSVKVIFD